MGFLHQFIKIYDGMRDQRLRWGAKTFAPAMTGNTIITTYTLIPSP